MITFVTTIHVLVCVFLIVVILLQAGRGGGMGAAFGGGSSTVFGGRGAQTFLGKVTSICAAVFMLTSVVLAYSSSKSSSVISDDKSPSTSKPIDAAPIVPSSAGPSNSVGSTAASPHAETTEPAPSNNAAGALRQPATSAPQLPPPPR